MSTMKTLTINGETYTVTPVVPKSSVTLSANSWTGSGESYSQVVTLSDVTIHTMVDLQPTPEQLEEFHYKTLAFVAENNGGVVTVYSIGDKPDGNYTIPVTLTEVDKSGKIRGNTAGTTTPRSDWSQTDPNKADFIKNKPTKNVDTDALVYRVKLTGGSNWNNAYEVGIYEVNTWTGSGGVGVPPMKTVGHLIVYSWKSSSLDSQFVVQELHNYENPNCVLRRISKGSTYIEWEWENPPMVLNTEYRTTERWQGKAVYTTLINCGAMPNNAQTITAHGKAMKTVLRCSGTAGTYVFPDSRTAGGTTSTDELCVSVSTVYITTNYDASANNAYVQVWYTKD